MKNTKSASRTTEEICVDDGQQGESLRHFASCQHQPAVALDKETSYCNTVSGDRRDGCEDQGSRFDDSPADTSRAGNRVRGTNFDGTLKRRIETSHDPKAESLTRGRWTDAEHHKFLQAIRLFGKDWRKVQEYIGSRTGA